ncbi:MAG: efflux RND transporter periplasmic adaptor subunit [Gemmataceae bacterium]
MEPVTQPRSRRWLAAARSVVTALAAVAGLGLFLAWMGGAFRDKVQPGETPVARPPAAGRTLVAVEAARSRDTVGAVGSVQPKKKAEVASLLLATILDVTVRPGDRVKPGQLLVALDDRELVAQHREATAAQTAAEADLVTRRTDYERLKRLRETGSVSADEFTKVEGAFRVADAQVARAKEAIARLAVQLTHTKILATGGGVVADRFVDPGDLAAPGKPLLVVYDPADLELHVNVPETLAPGLAPGQPLAVRIDAAGLAATGTVREVVPQAQQASRSVLVKVALPAAPATGRPLLPGMFGRVEVPAGEAERLWLPRAAVRQTGQLDLVDVAGPDGTLGRRFVRVGAAAGDKVEILAGLAAGERVALPAESPNRR